MDIKANPEKTSDLKSEQENSLNDYEILIQKLSTIKNIIASLDINFKE